MFFFPWRLGGKAALADSPLPSSWGHLSTGLYGLQSSKGAKVIKPTESKPLSTIHQNSLHHRESPFITEKAPSSQRKLGGWWVTGGSWRHFALRMGLSHPPFVTTVWETHIFPWTFYFFVQFHLYRCPKSSCPVVSQNSSLNKDFYPLSAILFLWGSTGVPN